MNSLASLNRERLFAGLEAFVNMGDSLEELRNFRQQWPSFFPISVYDEAEQSAQPGLAELVEDESVAHFLHVYRNWLRQIWRNPESAPPEWLFWMLGIEPDDRSQYSPLEVYVPLAKYRFNWKTGQFEYEAAFDFQNSLYLLLKSSWRAKVCAFCSRYFIAGKSAQLYCGTQCSTAVKRERGNDWWKREGNRWRELRKKSAASRMGTRRK